MTEKSKFILFSPCIFFLCFALLCPSETMIELDASYFCVASAKPPHLSYSLSANCYEDHSRNEYTTQIHGL